MGWKQWESSAFPSACRKGSKRWMCHTDMSTPAWISTNHECRENDWKERRGRGCKGGWALGCATREKKWRLAPKKLHSLRAGLGQGVGARACLAPWKQGSKSWKPARLGNSQAHTGSRRYSRHKMDRIEGTQMQPQAQAKGRSQVTGVSQT